MNSQTEKPYWVAFNHISGIGAVRSGLLLKRFGSLEEAWTASGSEFLHCGIPEKTVDSILEFRSKWYLFYHDCERSGGINQKRNVKFCSLEFEPDGSIRPIDGSLK